MEKRVYRLAAWINLLLIYVLAGDFGFWNIREQCGLWLDWTDGRDKPREILNAYITHSFCSSRIRQCQHLEIHNCQKLACESLGEVPLLTEPIDEVGHQ